MIAIDETFTYESRTNRVSLLKVALIGNMNNNNFALMRYMRDLGVDAHLLLYANDGAGSLRHFTPEADTWTFEKWRPYIHQTLISNSPISALDFPWGWAVSVRSWIRTKLKRQDFIERPASRSLIRSSFTGYGKIIGSGIAPAALNRAGVTLDIFYPYATGIEYLRTYPFYERLQRGSLVARIFYRLVAKKQAEGILKTRTVVKSETGQTQEVLEEIGVRAETLLLPMVYIGDSPPSSAPSEHLRKANEAMIHSQFTILHHARLIFENALGLDHSEWVHRSKNNHWLLRGFAQLVAERPHLNPLLLLVEYGEDVDAAKRMIEELGLVNNVYWLPLLQRRELMWLLSRVTIGCGEFHDLPRMMWGGTGWESFASGKPLLQGFNFQEGEFDLIYGYPPPPMLPVREEGDILKHLLDIADHPEKGEAIGQGAKGWFQRYNGIGLVKQWLKLLMVPREFDTRHKCLK